MPFGYPIALEVAGRKCVVVGGGEVAEQKTRALLEAHAAVVVVAGHFTEGLEELDRQERVRLVRRDYSHGDLEGAFLAIAASDDRSRNAEIFAEAEEEGVLLNAVDDVPHCHFAAPSIIRRGDFLLTLSTGGKAPALAKKLRKELSGQFGPEYGRLVDLLGRVREKMLPKRKVDFDTWAQRWGEAMSEDLIGLVRQGRVDEAEARVAALIGETTRAEPDRGSHLPPETNGAEHSGRSHYADDPGRDTAERSREGMVWIVGAGPGDPDLITVGGRRALGQADVVVADRLVNPDLVAGKEVVYVGKEPGPGQVAQSEINGVLIRLAREGRKVARLKGGDPFVFGRGSEEAEALREAGIQFSVIPGTSSALAAVAAAGIPVTDRRFASSVAIVTGHSADSESEYPGPDFARLATAVDTIVILMGLANLQSIVDQLIAGGRPPKTPSVIIENGTLPSQRVVCESLDMLPSAAKSAHIQSPGIIVVGEVVNLRGKISN